MIRGIGIVLIAFTLAGCGSTVGWLGGAAVMGVANSASDSTPKRDDSPSEDYCEMYPKSEKCNDS